MGEGGLRVSIGRIEAGVPFANLTSGTPQLTDLTLSQVVLQLPLLRERRVAPAAPAASPPITIAMPSFDRLRVIDGAVVLSNPQDNVQARIDGITNGHVYAAMRGEPFEEFLKTRNVPGAR
mgnify:CR=1 FL=1